MLYINYAKEKCNHCYRCIRACSPKAISIYEDSAEILEALCISCGECLITCEQDALYIKNKVHQVQRAIQSKKKVVASLDPSFPGVFSIQSGQMVKALKKLGFDYVEETAIGGDMVAKAYEEFLQASQQKHIITTSCPSTNYLIEKYYPELCEYMIPVISPMIAHGKYIKEKYGQDVHVAYIGPCIARKVEAGESQYQGVVDSVLTFVELEQWIADQGIMLEQLPLEAFDGKGSKVGQEISFQSEDINQYERIMVSGISKVQEILDSMVKGEVDHIFLEADSCEGGCIDGTGMPKDATSYYTRRKRVHEYIHSHPLDVKDNDRDIPGRLELSRSFKEQRVEIPKYSLEEIEGVLRSMGKNSKADELNCDACGYDTCRKKAESILMGRSQINMCLPYMREKAESVKNVIFDQSPNLIIMVSCDDLRIKEFNPSSERVFQIKADEIKGKRVQIIMPGEIFENVLNTKINTIGQKIECPQFGTILIANILYVEEDHILMAIMTDITSEEKNKDELERVKENTINTAQEVINKQMRVAQEIASLLGETTAETKVTLTKLKDIVVGERGGEK